MSTESKPTLQTKRVQIREVLSDTRDVALMIGLTSPISLFLYFILQGDSGMVSHLIGAGLYAVGNEVDSESTISAVLSIRRFESLSGIRSQVREGNPRLPARPTRDDVYSPRERIRDALFWVASLYFPGVGIVLGSGGLFYGFKNLRIARAHEKEATELLSNRIIP